MLEQYLQGIGITTDEISKIFPDMEEDMHNYLAIKQMGDEDYKDEMEKLSLGLVDVLKERNDAIQEYLNKPKIEETQTSQPESVVEDEDFDFSAMGLGTETATTPKPETPQIQSEIETTEEEFDFSQLGITLDAPQVVEIPAVANKGNIVRQAEVTPSLWMKMLVFSGIDYKYKTNPNATEKNKFYYWVGDDFYFVTNKNPFEEKLVDIYIYSKEGKELSELYSIVQSKAVSFLSKGSTTQVFNLKDVVDVITQNDEEPVTKLPYKFVDEAVENIWKLESVDELYELVSLSKKYGCGCGSI